MPRKNDILVGTVALALAVWVTSGFWVDPNGKASLVNSGDQALFEWLLSYGAYAITQGADPLYTYLLNAPGSVNLSVNTSITVYAVVFAPLTMWLGAPAVFLLILTLNLAASAFAWYWLFNRYLGASPLGAAIGGLFCGFAPAMISHANAHLNWTAQWLIPLIIAQVVRLYRGARPVRTGILLGVLVAACFSIAAEALFFAALAMLVFSLFWVCATRPPIRNVLKGLGVGAAVAAIFLAYPLWLHFAGPQSFQGTGFDPKVHNEDLAAYAAWPERSVAGALHLNTHLAPNPTEENSFFGLPLLALVIVAFVILWRRTSSSGRTASSSQAAPSGHAAPSQLAAASGRAAASRRADAVGSAKASAGVAAWPSVPGLALTAAVFTLLSLGPELRFMGRLTGIWMPEALLSKAPIFNAALPSRLALIVAPIFGLILAWLISSPKPWQKPVWIAAFAAALVPLLPLPIGARDREPVPHFFTSGAWMSYVDGNSPVIAPVPLPNDLVPDGQRWQAYALAHSDRVFRIPSGFFLGPGGPNGTGRIGPIPRPTAELLETVAKTGQVPAIGQAERDRAREDLHYWDAQIVVLADTVSGAHWDPHQPALLKTMTDLLGPPQRVDDVWLWRV